MAKLACEHAQAQKQQFWWHPQMHLALQNQNAGLAAICTSNSRATAMQCTHLHVAPSEVCLALLADARVWVVCKWSNRRNSRCESGVSPSPSPKPPAGHILAVQMQPFTTCNAQVALLTLAA